MIKAILKGILKMVIRVLNVFLLPINALFTNLFPNMTQAINHFNNFVNTYIGGTLSYFFSILPPIFRSILAIWITYLISYYGIIFAYKGFLKIWQIIQKLKFW